MSWIGTHKSIWPRVTSSYAHEVVQTAYEALPIADPGPDMLESHIVYRRWLVEKLQASQLSQLLPGGTDLLPDFYTALPAWQRPLAALSKPRSYADLVRHVIGHLDWYLDPTRIAKAYTFNPAVLGMMSVSTLLCVGAAVLMRSEAFLFPLGFVLIGLSASLQPYRAMYRDINAEEFYRYIKEAYSDPRDVLNEGFVAALAESQRGKQREKLPQ